MKTKLEQMREAAVELAEYASYAELVGGIRDNRARIRRWCDEVFRLDREIKAEVKDR